MTISAMERIRSLFTKPVDDGQEYTPLGRDTEDSDEATLTSVQEQEPFSWLEYTVFLLLGIAMLWAW